MPLYVHNIRLGYATNSSSTHSILILPADHTTKDYLVADQQFGWENFTAASVAAKLAWLGQAVRENIQAVALDADASALAAERMIADHGGSVQLLRDGYVDHQSRFDAPTPAWGEDRQFFSGLVAFLSDPRVVVVGGNDNVNDEWTPHELKAAHPALDYDLFREQRGSLPTLRYDKRDRYWSAFHCGVTRFRLAAEPGPEIVRSEVPELVDLSIGNRCTFGCAYCYRGSTPDQGYASEPEISSILHHLSRMGVFEVALGGGEPLQHPDIEEIVLCAKLYKIKIHVTTRDLSWLRNPLRRRVLLENVTAFGYSVDTPKQAERAAKAFVAEGLLDRLNLQVVVGATTEKTLREILKIAKREHVRVTLLGYKTSGFGARVQPHPVSPSVIQEHYLMGIDSVLAQQWETWLRENHVWKGSYALSEGAFSCFIDAERGTLHRSSFDGSEGYSIRKRERWMKEGETHVNAESIQAAYDQMQRGAGIVVDNEA